MEVTQNPHSEFEFRWQKAASTKICVGDVRYEFVDWSQVTGKGIMICYEGKLLSALKICFSVSWRRETSISLQTLIVQLFCL
jgi:hypothetical protein